MEFSAIRVRDKDRRSRAKQVQRGSDAVDRVMEQLHRLGWVVKKEAGHGEYPDVIATRIMPDAHYVYLIEVKSIRAFTIVRQNGSVKQVHAQNVKLENAPWRELRSSAERMDNQLSVTGFPIHAEAILLVEIRAGPKRHLYKWLPSSLIADSQKRFRAVNFWFVIDKGRPLSALAVWLPKSPWGE